MQRPTRSAVLAVTLALGGQLSGAPAHAAKKDGPKPFDPVAFRGIAEATAMELEVAGAMVLSRTPQGEFAFGYGSTALGVTALPHADMHFRAASNTKTMTAGDRAAGTGTKIALRRSGLEIRPNRVNGNSITISQLLRLARTAQRRTQRFRLSEPDRSRRMMCESLAVKRRRRHQVVCRDKANVTTVRSGVP